MPRPIHFELEAENPERAIRFYEEALGWKISKWEGPMEYWLILTGEGEGGIDGGLGRRSGPPSGTTNTLGVESLDESIARVLAAGGRLRSPRHAVPGVGWMAYCEDTEGNAFGLMQEDPTAG
jgi:predicted enzyme related to lactoylglutathione lyase